MEDISDEIMELDIIKNLENIFQRKLTITIY